MSVAYSLDFQDRHYDVRTGRFISEDTIGFAGRDTNLYRYTENNPVLRVDPTGNLWQVAFGAVIGGASGAYAAGEGNRLRGFAVGAVSGALSSVGFGGLFVGGFLSGASDVALQLSTGRRFENLNTTSIVVSTIAGSLGTFAGNLTSRFIQLPSSLNILGKDLVDIGRAGTTSNQIISSIIGGITGGLLSIFGNPEMPSNNQCAIRR